MKIVSLILLVATFQLGCATIDVHNQPTPPAPYLGTGKAFKNTADSIFDYDYFGEVFVRVWDIPLCFIADTLLLPYDIYHIFDHDDAEPTRSEENSTDKI